MPSKKGNQFAKTHGATAKLPAERVEAATHALTVKLAQQAPVRAPDGSLPVHDELVVEMLAETMEHIRDVRAWIAKYGAMDRTDRRAKVRNAVEKHRRLQSHALRLMRELGMTPSSRAKLGLNLARTFDLASALSNPDRTQGAKELAEAGIAVDDTPDTE